MKDEIQKFGENNFPGESDTNNPESRKEGLTQSRNEMISGKMTDYLFKAIMLSADGMIDNVDNQRKLESWFHNESGVYGAKDITLEEILAMQSLSLARGKKLVPQIKLMKDLKSLEIKKGSNLILALTEMPNIEKVVLKEVDYSELDVSILLNMPWLKNIHLAPGTIIPKEIIRLRRLEEVIITGSIPMTKSDMESISSLQYLKKLTIPSSSAIYPELLKKMGGLNELLISGKTQLPEEVFYLKNLTVKRLVGPGEYQIEKESDQVVTQKTKTQVEFMQIKSKLIDWISSFGNESYDEEIEYGRIGQKTILKDIYMLDLPKGSNFIPEVAEFTNLEVVRVMDSDLESLPDYLFKIPKLAVLNLTGSYNLGKNEKLMKKLSDLIDYGVLKKVILPDGTELK